jgi:hypothetical protein
MKTFQMLNELHKGTLENNSAILSQTSAINSIFEKIKQKKK